MKSDLPTETQFTTVVFWFLDNGIHSIKKEWYSPHGVWSLSFEDQGRSGIMILFDISVVASIGWVFKRLDFLGYD